MLNKILILTLLVIVNVSAINTLRRKTYTVDTKQLDGKFKDIAEKNGGKVDKSGLMTVDGLKSEDLKTPFIIGDLGSSGTRLIVGLGGKVYVMPGFPAIYVPGKDSKTNEAAVSGVVNKVLEVFGPSAKDAVVILLATAGGRQMFSDKRVKPDAIDKLCSMIKGYKKCTSQVMFGALEGYLGWLDGANQDDSCYIEFGGASAQFAHAAIIEPANVQVTGKRKKSLYILSGVSLGFNILGAHEATNEVCSCEKHVGKFADGGRDKKCLSTAIDTFLDEKPTGGALKKCMDSYIQWSLKSKTKCKKLIVRGIDPENTKGPWEVVSKYKCKDATSTYDICQKAPKDGTCGSEFPPGVKQYHDCGKGLMWGEWFCRLGVLDQFQSEGANTNLKKGVNADWFSGMVQLLPDIDYNFDQIQGSGSKPMTGTVSDCMELKITTKA